MEGHVIVLFCSQQGISLRVKVTAKNTLVRDHFAKMCQSVHHGRFERIEKGFAAQYTVGEMGMLPGGCNGPRADRTNRHDKYGTVGIAIDGGMLTNTLYFTLSDKTRYMDEAGWVVGRVADDSIASLRMLERCLVDTTFKPLETITLACGSKPEREIETALAAEAEAGRGGNRPVNEPERWEREQKLRLQLLGDRRAGDMRRASDIRTVFVARLSPHTSEDDLAVVFSRFGTVTDCHIVKRLSTAAATCFAFIQFSTVEECDEAVRKMNNAILDDRRIRVDYAHSANY